MSYTKGELAQNALTEIGIASYDFDISAEMLSSAIGRLNSMMAEWSIKGILLSFPIEKENDSDSDTDSGVPDWAWEAVVTNLAVRIGPSYGKTVSSDTKIAAKNSYDTICGMFTKPLERQLNPLPRGAGAKSTGSQFTPKHTTQYWNTDEEKLNPQEGEL